METKTSKRNKYTIKVIKTTKYRNFPIYIRQIGYMFEYLTIIHKQIYAANVIVKPKWHRRFLAEPYTGPEFEGAKRLLRKMAEATIDFVYYQDKNAMKKLNATPKNGKRNPANS